MIGKKEGRPQFLRVGLLDSNGSKYARLVSVVSVAQIQAVGFEFPDVDDRAVAVGQVHEPFIVNAHARRQQAMLLSVVYPGGITCGTIIQMKDLSLHAEQTRRGAEFRRRPADPPRA